MSNSNGGVSGTVLIVGIVCVFCFTVAGVVALTVAVPEGQDPSTLVTLLLGSLAPTVAAIAGLVKVAGVGQRVEQVARQTDEMANGLMDAKIRAGVADVLPDDLVDDQAHAQLEVDRQRRDRGA